MQALHGGLEVARRRDRDGVPEIEAVVALVVMGHAGVLVDNPRPGPD